MKFNKYLAATLLSLSGTTVFAGSCEVMQSLTSTIAETNPNYPPASAVIGGIMDLSPLTGSDFSRDKDPMELYLDGVRLQNVQVASLDDIHWWTTDLVMFGSASVKNFHLVMNFNDGSTIECDSDIEVRYDDADPIVNQVRYDLTDLEGGGVEVNVRAQIRDSDHTEFVVAEYELASGPNVDLPVAEVDYDPSFPVDSYIRDQKLTFTEPGDYELHIRVTDENGNTNISESVSFSIEGGCITSTNFEHVSAGRAYDFFGFSYAVGSSAWLGYTAFGESTLEELWPGYWLPVLSCD